MNPEYDPNAQYGDPSNPASKTNIPGYTGPSQNYTDMWESLRGMMGGPQGLTNVTSGIRENTQPTSFMSQLPWDQKQIGGWLNNQFSGKGAQEQADEFRNRGIADVNRTFQKGYRDLSGSIAGAGGRGSSGASRMMAEGMGEYQGARSNVMGNAQALEDKLRNDAFGRGMTGLSAYEGANRGDWTQTLQKAELDLSTLNPELSAWGTGAGIGQNLLGNEQNQQNSQNAWNQQIWSQLMQPHPNASWYDQGLKLFNSAAPYTIPKA